MAATPPAASTARRDRALIYAAALLRSSAIGLTGVVLGVYLAQTGYSAPRIGVVIAAGLAGVAAATALVTFRADRLGRRPVLIALALAGAAGALGVAWTSEFAAVVALAFTGMLNGMGRDRGPAFVLEQAILPATVAPERRTWALAWYNMVLDAGHALGALAAAAPLLLRVSFGLDLLDSYRATFALLAVVNLASAALYAWLSRGVEVAAAETPARPTPALTPASKRIVTRLAGLFALDSLGGGFLTTALVAYWFFQRFGAAEESLALLFFAARVLNSVSYLGAAALARRIGLVNTMVWTHIPSSLFLLALPLMPTFPWAVALFLAREALVEMDVPTRQSYVVAVVRPEERTFASGVTNLTRSVAWAVAPSLAGVLMKHLSLAAPLVIGGGMKIVYDLLLYAAFRRIRPPEEAADAAARAAPR